MDTIRSMAIPALSELPGELDDPMFRTPVIAILLTLAAIALLAVTLGCGPAPAPRELNGPSGTPASDPVVTPEPEPEPEPEPGPAEGEQSQPVHPEPEPEAGSGEVIWRWSPDPASDLAMGFAIIDRQARVIYAMITPGGSAPRAAVRGGAPQARILVARRIRDGKRLWKNRNAVVPVAVENGRLLAIQQGQGHLVVLDARTGKTESVCTGAAPGTVGEGLGWSKTVSFWRKDGKPVVISRHRTWYAGGKAPTPEQEEAARRATVSAMQVAVTRGSCTATAVPAESLELDKREARYRLLRRQVAGEWIFSVEKQGQEPVDVGRGPSPTAAPSLDGAHVVVNQMQGTPPSVHYAVTIFDVAQGKVILQLQQSQSFPQVVLLGDRIVLGHPGYIAVVNTATGKTVWDQVLSGFAYTGPYPP